MLHTVLLAIHIIAGAVSLLAAITGVVSKAINLPHRTHMIAGLAFVLGMGVIFLTGMPLAYLGSNIFLSMIGVLSGYLALSGWRYARNRDGAPAWFDWFAAGVMLIVSFGMVIYGGLLIARGFNMGAVLVLFGVRAALFSSTDLRIFRAGGVTGKERIVQHLGMMLGGTTAALTAFSANAIGRHLPQEWMFIAWLWPILLITPLAAYWKRRVLVGQVSLA